MKNPTQTVHRNCVRGPRPRPAAQQEPAGVTGGEGAAVLLSGEARGGLEWNGVETPSIFRKIIGSYEQYHAKSTFINHGESCESNDF